jgi:type IV pilus assembly protein PilB
MSTTEESGLRDELYRDMNIIRQISDAYINNYGILPLHKDGESLIAAMLDIADADAIKFVSELYNCVVKPVLVTQEEWELLINGEKPGPKYIEGSAKIISGFVDVNTSDFISNSDLSNLSPIIKFVNTIISLMIESQSTHLFIEPKYKDLQISCYNSGKEIGRISYQKYYQIPLLNRLKIMADINLVASRIPQAGYINLKHNGREYIICVNTMPTINGELCRLEIHHKQQINLVDLGADEKLIDKLFSTIRSKTTGIIIVAAPQEYLLKKMFHAIFYDEVFKEKHLICIEEKVSGWQSPQGVHCRANQKTSFTLEMALASAIEMDFDCIAIDELNCNIAKMVYKIFGRLVFVNIIAEDIKAVERQLVNVLEIPSGQYRSQTIAVLFADGDNITLNEIK